MAGISTCCQGWYDFTDWRTLISVENRNHSFWARVSASLQPLHVKHMRSRHGEINVAWNGPLARKTPPTFHSMIIPSDWSQNLLSSKTLPRNLDSQMVTFYSCQSSSCKYYKSDKLVQLSQALWGLLREGSVGNSKITQWCSQRKSRHEKHSKRRNNKTK